MKRYTGQQALYEAISRSRAKTQQRSILERLRPEPAKPESPAGQDPPPQQVEPEPAAEEPSETAVQTPVEPQAVETTPQPVSAPEPEADSGPAAPPEQPSEAAPEPVERIELAVRSRPIDRIGHAAPSGFVQPWLRPRPVQLNEGRIEISVPYYVGIIAGLVALAIVLAAFRLGQAGRDRSPNDAGMNAQPVVNRSDAPANPPARPATQDTTTNTDRAGSAVSAATANRQTVAPPVTQGDHVIVLAHYARTEDFEPVKRHFAEFGIELGYMAVSDLREYFAKKGLNSRNLPSDGYLLVTKDFVENPNVSGTNGYNMLQQIVKVGALYKGKAPSGVESFGPHYFEDAYGMKIQ